MSFSVRYLAIGLFCSLLFCACNGYEKVLKSKDVSYKLTKANEYYDKKQYQKANDLYASLIPVMKGTKNFEPLYYRYAYSYYNLKDYLSASYHFKNFVDFFPTSKDADECEYMNALCLYKMAPKASLEQTNTIKAMEALQSYINMHPESKRVAEANNFIDDSRKKLEEKEASAAKLYFTIGQYKAANIAYKSVIRNYPESPNSDYYQYMSLRAMYNYARQSVTEKQEERYSSVVNAYREMADLYPHSKLLKDAERYQTLADNNIKKLRVTQ